MLRPSWQGAVIYDVTGLGDTEAVPSSSTTVFLQENI